MPGEAAIITLNATVGGASGFTIDSYGRGIEQIFDVGVAGNGGGNETPESVCGTLDWRDAECYRNSYPTEFEQARAATKAVIGCCSRPAPASKFRTAVSG